MKAKCFLVLAAIIMIIGYSMHLSICIHPNRFGFLVWNFVAHVFIWSSVFFAMLCVKNMAVAKVEVKLKDKVIDDAYDLATDATITELNFMIIGTRILKVLFSRMFVIIFNLITQLSICYLLFKSNGDFSIFFVGLGTNIILNKYLVMRCWGVEMDNMKRDAEIELFVFREIKELKKNLFQNDKNG